MAPRNVAIVTGGASGMGLAVSKELAARKDWDINIIDLHEERGNEAATEIGASFHRIDVSSYASLAEAFKKIFAKDQRLDFVFANAGIIEKDDFYKVHNTGKEPPPQLPTAIVDINLTSVITTCYLAQHYFRQSANTTQSPRSIVITASCGGIYAAPTAPIYAASKFGTVGFMRSIAPKFWRNDGIRVNAILPGPVRTNLAADQFWNTFPAELMTSLEEIVEVVMMLLHGEDKKANGTGSQKPLVGQAVEINCQDYHFRKQHDFCDPAISRLHALGDG